MRRLGVKFGSWPWATVTDLAMDRMRKVVERIVASDCLSSPDSALYLTQSERTKIREKLSSPIGKVDVRCRGDTVAKLVDVEICALIVSP
jgi:hypothetical protein